MRQVWGVAERKFKDDFKRRMMTFDSLLLEIMMYGMQLIAWKESVKMEWIQLKYIEWSLGLDRCTPDYIIFAETNRQEIRIRAGRRATKFEDKLVDKRLLSPILIPRIHCTDWIALSFSAFTRDAARGIVAFFFPEFITNDSWDRGSE